MIGVTGLEWNSQQLKDNDNYEQRLWMGSDTPRKRA